MRRCAPRRTTAVIAALAFLGGGAALAAPASAAPAGPAAGTALRCATPGDSRDLDLPGDKPDTQVHAENCVQIQSGATGPVTGRTVLHWGILVDQVIDRSKRFTSVKVTTRLESRPTATGSDTVRSSRTCDVTADLNAAWANSTGLNCHAAPVDYDGQWWSTDATVVYDLEGDGRGPVTWELLGSPQTKV
ncbi:hypothetical protein [Streptomyces clavuligerus]|uniref:Secreted protein n=1 Tax=Streptomyces clavuligerus TaxID=1901 RepID=E2PY59_STRCL|nr:hypothetical protein [Streptomyces clavuligerus]ANW17295.1 hypothetical protein BB341_03185 [Streptomyces clavuligerus]AXU11841.1 hypothetical protein D1794_03345 [Streptomyces clavuligerus]EFG10235.1 Hypothetical protein SCLAV_5161 [Streptomyces clavuligerus]MBY6301678.1 hypothetical protein [Streptomyces clavuligerus]QCS04619.1 hypothetical protein CRV15_02775 [Streptomyces clavuligerus]